MDQMAIDEASASTSSQPAKSKLGNCEVCSINEAKYTCPKCEVKFCCLKCSTIHKKELECNGARDRTKFIPINKFTNLDLSSDYRLLEEIGRHVETYKKDPIHKFRARNEILPHFLHKLRQSLKSKNTTIKFLPANFLRHKENTTRLNFRRDVVYWHIDWIFPNAENLKLIDPQARETEKIGSILQKYFVKQDNELLQEKLQYYQSLGLPGIKVFLRAEEKPGDKYYELDLDESLRNNLKNKIIIEYPTLFVINKDHCDAYNLVDSDDEMDIDADKKTECGDAIISRMIKRAESEESINNSLKNLLFVTENSDTEDK